MPVETWVQREFESILAQRDSGRTIVGRGIRSYYWYPDAGDMEPYLFRLKTRLMDHGVDAVYEYFTCDNPDEESYDGSVRVFTRHGQIHIQAAEKLNTEV